MDWIWDSSESKDIPQNLKSGILLEDMVTIFATCVIGVVLGFMLWTYALSTFQYASKWIAMMLIYKSFEWYVKERIWTTALSGIGIFPYLYNLNSTSSIFASH
jgi:hypothetical protein